MMVQDSHPEATPTNSWHNTEKTPHLTQPIRPLKKYIKPPNFYSYLLTNKCIEFIHVILPIFLHFFDPLTKCDFIVAKAPVFISCQSNLFYCTLCKLNGMRGYYVQCIMTREASNGILETFLDTHLYTTGI
jgi:hypothetical protein